MCVQGAVEAPVRAAGVGGGSGRFGNGTVQGDAWVRLLKPGRSGAGAAVVDAAANTRCGNGYR